MGNLPAGWEALTSFAGIMLNLFVNPPRAAHRFGYWRGPLLVLLAFADLAFVTFLFITAANSSISIILISVLMIGFAVLLGLGLRHIYRDVVHKEYKKLADHYRFWRKYH